MWSAQDAGPAAAGLFYSNVAKLFIKKYGYDLPIEEDLAEDVEDPPDDAIEEADPSTVGLSEKEAARHASVYTNVRLKISQWYRHHYKKLVKTDRRTDALQSLMEDIAQMVPSAPRKLRAVQYYSKRYYETRVKARFDAEWEHVQAAWEIVEESGNPDGLRQPERISVCNRVTQEAYNEESEEFRQQLDGRAQAEHTVELEAFKARLEEGMARSPEQFHAVLADIAYVLQPFADLMTERFGMATSILMAGPIGELGGKIEMRTVHSGLTYGLLQKKWPEFDPEAMQVIRESMIRFAQHVFTPEQIRERALPNTLDLDALETFKTKSPEPSAAGLSGASTQQNVQGLDDEDYNWDAPTGMDLNLGEGTSGDAVTGTDNPDHNNVAPRSSPPSPSPSLDRRYLVSRESTALPVASAYSRSSSCGVPAGGV
ncbi:hypothetical protein PLICRDRAFT_177280 [Plicaturopsis crispa FD-325 SS-3]|nr:hypothetical protein PLICRDRAFT_177280 [Plicaturopsis crispa FD-325 SS-3]